MKSMVKVFGVVHHPIYRGLFNTGRQRAETVKAVMEEEKARRYIQQLEDEGCDVNLKVTPASV